MRQIAKAIVNFCQPRDVFSILALAFGDRFPGRQRFVGPFEDVEVLAQVLAVLRFAGRKFDGFFVTLDRRVFQASLAIEVSDLRVSQRVVGSCFYNTAPNFQSLFATFCLFNFFVTHHQLAPVTEKVRIARSRLDQFGILFGSFFVALIVDQLINETLPQIRSLGSQLERLFHPLTGFLDPRRRR